jgi:KDO2-lipid IV(A) lauroyltransferase
VMKGGAITVLIDQRNTGAPMIPFMGQPAETATALAELSARTGAPMIPVRARRLEDGLSFDVKFEEPLPHGDPEAMMAEMNRRIEGWIDEEPGQWFWLHRRWKHRQRELTAEAAEGDPA